MSTEEVKQNGWNEYSKLVLSELVKLNTNYEKLATDVTQIKIELAKFKTINSNIDEIKEWKSNIEKVVTIEDLSKMKKDIEKLGNFKSRTLMIGTIASFLLLMGCVIIEILNYVSHIPK